MSEGTLQFSDEMAPVPIGELAFLGQPLTGDGLVVRRSAGFWCVPNRDVKMRVVGRGKSVRDVDGSTLLHDGETLFFPSGRAVFRETGRDEEVESERKRLVANVAEKPNDEPRWQVYRDWLCERGESRGDRVAARETSWPEPIARYIGPEVVHAQWYAGHVTTLRLFRAESGPDCAQLTLALWSGVSELVTSIVIDSSAIASFSSVQERLSHARLPALRSIDSPLRAARLRMPHCPYISDFP